MCWLKTLSFFGSGKAQTRRAGNFGSPFFFVKSIYNFSAVEVLVLGSHVYS
jgi:hypothetical protein